MNDAVVVSYARTALAKSFKGGFNTTTGASLGAHVIEAAIQRAGIDQAEIEDVMLGCGFPEGTTGGNIARQSALLAGCPQSVAGMTLNRFCSSGLQTIALAAQRISSGEGDIYIAGGVESISAVQPFINQHMAEDASLKEKFPGVYWSMIETAEEVARRYTIDRQRQDEYGVRSQQLASKAQMSGLFAEEIVPLKTSMTLFDKETRKPSGSLDVTVTEDEGIRSNTDYATVSSIKSVIEGGTVSAGNASQLSDGAAATVIMSSKRAQQLNLEPLGIFRGFAVAGCDPEVMGIGPIYAVPKLLKRCGLTVDDIDLWELNEAFAVQVLCCSDKLGIPMERLNVNGGAIALGHPYGVSGTRVSGSGLLEARRRGAKYLVTTMCIAAGMGAAALFEVV